MCTLVKANNWMADRKDLFGLVDSHLLPLFDKIFSADVSHDACGQGITHHVDHGSESISGWWNQKAQKSHDSVSEVWATDMLYYLWFKEKAHYRSLLFQSLDMKRCMYSEKVFSHDHLSFESF